MTATVTHPYGRRIREAGLGHFPAPDQGPEVGPALPGPCDAVAFFTGHTLVAADVGEEWVVERLRAHGDSTPDDASTGHGLFLQSLSKRLGHPPLAISLLLVAPYQSAFLHGRFEPGGEVDPDWEVYRDDVRAYRYRSTGVSGVFALGRGPGGRWDVYVRVDRYLGGGGHASREILTVARTLVPDRDLLFASAPLHDPRVIRAAVGGGFLPICTEALLLTRAPS